MHDAVHVVSVHWPQVFAVANLGLISSTSLAPELFQHSPISTMSMTTTVTPKKIAAPGAAMCTPQKNAVPGADSAAGESASPGRSPPLPSSSAALAREIKEADNLATGNVNHTLPVMWSLQKQARAYNEACNRALDASVEEHDKTINKLRERAAARKRKLEEEDARAEARAAARDAEREAKRNARASEGRRLLDVMGDAEKNAWCWNHRRCKPGKCISSHSPRCGF